jgi:hypothetical protein
MIFAVTLFFALVTLHTMVECIVCNTFIYLSEHLPSVTGIVRNTFLQRLHPRCNGLKLLQYAKNDCSRQNCNIKIWLGGVAIVTVAIVSGTNIRVPKEGGLMVINDQFAQTIERSVCDFI